MKEKTKLILTNLGFNIAFYGLVLVIVYFLSPLHELFHYIPCKLAGLTPKLSYFNVSCLGIEGKSHFIQFFTFMGPYIFSLLALIGLCFLSKKYTYLKYLIPIPVFDTAFNYVSSLNKSDFLFLLQNTYPDKVPFTLSMILVVIMLLITFWAYFRFRIYSFKEIVERMKKR